MSFCIIENCNNIAYCKQLCNNHYKNKWQKDNKQKRKEILQKYHSSDKHKRTHRNYNSTTKGHFSHLKNSLKRASRILECTLSFAEYEILINKNCYYCNGPLFVSAYGGGLDRINNDLGYIQGNVLPCCGECNKLRMDRLSVEETLEVVKLLKRVRNKENIWQ